MGCNNGIKLCRREAMLTSAEYLEILKQSELSKIKLENDKDQLAVVNKNLETKISEVTKKLRQLVSLLEILEKY